MLKKRLLIIGKTSYVGTSVSQYLKDNYSEIEVVSISSRNYTWQKFDFSRFDVVFNVSGLCHADSKHGTQEMYMEINAQLPILMAKKAKSEGVKLFINMSSMIVYGNMSHIGVNKVIDSSTIPVPCNIYGESKVEAESGLLKLEDESFGIAIIRAPLIYGENARDNFPRLVKYSKTRMIFPNIDNSQSMIYIDNFAELVHLIILHNQRGIFLPQDKEYIHTSQLVKDIAMISGNKMILTRFFNPIIYLLSKRFYLFDKVFGNITYTKEASGCFNNKYCVIDYKKAIQRIAKNKSQISEDVR